MLFPLASQSLALSVCIIFWRPLQQVSLMDDSQEKLVLQEKVSSLSNQLALVEGQLGVANDRLVQQERSRVVLEMAGTERLEEIRVLTREVEGLRLRSESIAELREKVNELEGELGKKQEEVMHIPHSRIIPHITGRMTSHIAE